jgi:hypothetical protein
MGLFRKNGRTNRKNRPEVAQGQNRLWIKALPERSRLWIGEKPLMI